jgi:hypothetical protein
MKTMTKLFALYTVIVFSMAAVSAKLTMIFRCVAVFFRFATNFIADMTVISNAVGWQ